MIIYKNNLRKRHLEAISSQVISLSLSNISRFYSSYINNNYNKVKSELDRVGYFVLKNKISIGNDSTSTKDVYISTYFVNMDMAYECNMMLAQKYHGNADVASVNGFFVPSTNELVVIVRVLDLEDIVSDLEEADIHSTIEHELTHAFDHTNKNKKFADQNITPGVGENFLSMCAYLGCANRSDLANIIGSDMLDDGRTSKCIYAISIIIYKLFSLTEFNAHQVSDLELLHRVDIKRSDKVRDALKKDILVDYDLTSKQLEDAVLVKPEELPELWTIVGNVLKYMGYNIRSESPNAVYKFFKRESEKLFKKFFDKKSKNQIKAIVSLKEKNQIKAKLIECVENDDLKRGFTFWFSPSGMKDSYICRVSAPNGKFNFTIGHNAVEIYGNANSVFNRVIDCYNKDDKSGFDFAVDNLVDLIVQTIERNFSNIAYDPVYDITAPQDEVQISKSNKRDNRFADLDWD